VLLKPDIDIGLLSIQQCISISNDVNEEEGSILTAIENKLNFVDELINRWRQEISKYNGLSVPDNIINKLEISVSNSWSMRYLNTVRSFDECSAIFESLFKHGAISKGELHKYVTSIRRILRSALL